MTVACIGLGSNLDQPVTQIRTACNALSRIPATVVLDCSSLYQSKPVGPQDQPDFINAVARLETALEPEELLGHLQRIEREQGRDRSGERWGPRTLDLDLLTYGDRVINSARLTLPHPEIPRRNFVLCPLLEIDCNMTIPGLGRVRDLLDREGTLNIKKLAEHE